MVELRLQTPIAFLSRLDLEKAGEQQTLAAQLSAKVTTGILYALLDIDQAMALETSLWDARGEPYLRAIKEHRLVTRGAPAYYRVTLGGIVLPGCRLAHFTFLPLAGHCIKLGFSLQSDRPPSPTVDALIAWIDESLSLRVEPEPGQRPVAEQRIQDISPHPATAFIGEGVSQDE